MCDVRQQQMGNLGSEGGGQGTGQEGGRSESLLLLLLRPHGKETKGGENTIPVGGRDEEKRGGGG